MNGVEVKPPVREKKVDRSKKSRRQQPQEFQGDTKLSKHGETWPGWRG
jgi:hypothetical protein